MAITTASSFLVAFKGAGIPESAFPVKNTFINYDGPHLRRFAAQRSSTCPPCFPNAYALADCATWEAATQVLCHAMAPKRETRMESSSVSVVGASPRLSPAEVCSIDRTSIATIECSSTLPHSLQTETSSVPSSCFVTPFSSPRSFDSVASVENREVEKDIMEENEWTEVSIKKSKKGKSEKGVVASHSLPDARSANNKRVSTKKKGRPESNAFAIQTSSDDPLVNSLSPPQPIAGSACHHSERFFVGIEDDDAFRVVRRLLGPGGNNLRRIDARCPGAKVWICGKGSCKDPSDAGNLGPLALCIKAATQDSFKLASELVRELLSSVQEQYEKFYNEGNDAQELPALYPKRTKTCLFKIGIDDTSDFGVVKRLIGPGGKHIKQIEEESTGAVVQVCGQHSFKVEHPLVIRVSAPTQASLESACVSAAALLARVQDDYRKYCASNGITVPVLKVFCEDAQ
mmetsp:Transcript_63838/g.99456  ORF Transcript_63838/g.99456 Transcript_63838/m.99456 type:complete len:459 (-) Transcript_63838:271-1647(-)